MKKFKFTFSMVIACLLLAIGCKSQGSHQKPSPAPSKKPYQALRINITSEPATLDPRRVRSLNDINVVKMVMEGLIRMNFEGQPVPGLAIIDTVSDDRKTYTFSLLKTFWSNGRPVTAHDFVYSWKKVLSPNFPADNASFLYVIKNAKLIREGKLPVSMLGVQAVDDSKLVVQLERPIPYFLELLASPVFYPVHAETDKTNPHWAENAETFVSCGPFKLSQWQHANAIEVVKHDEYWDEENVKLKKITMCMVAPETGFNMYQNHELDWEGSPFSSIPLDAMESLKKTGELQTQSFLITSFIRTNTQKAPFSSVHVRKALALAMNRNSLIEHVLGGFSAYASGLVPASLGLKESEYFQDGNISQAKELLEAAIKSGEIVKKDLSNITLSFLSNDKNYRICQVIQQQWKEALDLEIKLEAVEPKVYFSRISTQDFQLALGSWVADFRDPINFLEVFRTREIGTNNTGWENHDYLSKLEKSYATPNADERKVLLQECEKILVEEMPIIPIWHGNLHYVRNNKLKNVALSDMGGIDFKWAFVDKDP